MTAASTSTIRHATGSLHAPDGLRLFEQSWTPEGPTRGRVLLVHGLKDHSGRYEHVGRFLAERGYQVRTFDLRGHGRSAGRRVWVGSFDEYLADLGAFIDHVRDGDSDAPPAEFLLGHSMGGAIALLFVLTRRPSFEGLILSGPALGLMEHPALIWLGKHVGRLLPRAPVTRINRAHISRSPEVLEASRVDPLVYRWPSAARTAGELIHATERIEQSMHELQLPTLVVHGTEDRLTDPRKSSLLQERTGGNVTVRLYDDLYHEVFNEPERETVLADVADWLDERVSASRA